MSKVTVVILEGNCNGEGDAYVAWLKKNHPNYQIDYRKNTSGVGGGAFDENGDEIENLSRNLWEAYCNS
jgi:hypothetical protein